MHEKTKSLLTAMVQEQFTATLTATADRERAKKNVETLKRNLEEAEGALEATKTIEEIQLQTLFDLNAKSELINSGTTVAEARRLVSFGDSGTHPDQDTRATNTINKIIADQKERDNG